MGDELSQWAVDPLVGVWPRLLCYQGLRECVHPIVDDYKSIGTEFKLTRQTTAAAAAAACFHSLLMDLKRGDSVEQLHNKIRLWLLTVRNEASNQTWYTYGEIDERVEIFLHHVINCSDEPINVRLSGCERAGHLLLDHERTIKAEISTSLDHERTIKAESSTRTLQILQRMPHEGGARLRLCHKNPLSYEPLLLVLHHFCLPLTWRDHDTWRGAILSIRYIPREQTQLLQAKFCQSYVWPTRRVLLMAAMQLSEEWPTKLHPFEARRLLDFKRSKQTHAPGGNISITCWKCDKNAGEFPSLRVFLRHEDQCRFFKPPPSPFGQIPSHLIMRIVTFLKPSAREVKVHMERYLGHKMGGGKDSMDKKLPEGAESGGRRGNDAAGGAAGGGTGTVEGSAVVAVVEAVAALKGHPQ
jgi:hypothetical protein